MSADGQRFLANVPVGGPEAAYFTVVTHWTTELARR